MSKIEEIEGIGPAYAEKLIGVGVRTTDDLLNVGATRNLLRKQVFQKL